MNEMPFTDRELETLEVLGGQRPRAENKAAVRKEDIAELARITSKAELAAGATPTKAEYDQLVYDFRRLVAALNNIAG